VQLKTGRSHKSVLMSVFGREEEWSTKTVYGIGAQTVYMLCCLWVCVGVLRCVVPVVCLNYMEGVNFSQKHNYNMAKMMVFLAEPNYMFPYSSELLFPACV
jgi:Na+-transporting NADH:ubiquinone oxidoreductase subunit NqrE